MWESVRDFSVKARDLRSVAELNNAFGRLAERWGFDTFAAVQVSTRSQDLRQPIARSLGKPRLDWIEHYRTAGHVYHDPGVRRVMVSTDPYWWSDAEAEATSARERLVFDEAREFGMKHGLAVPVRLADGSVWSCVLAAEHVERSEELTLAATTVAHLFVGRGVVLQAREARQIDMAYKLTARQREVLIWLARGLTADEIGEVLGLSGKTVSNHLDDCKRRLSARTQAGVLAEALLRGGDPSGPYPIAVNALLS